MDRLNSRQEAFAQAVAAGKTQAEAYELAGFKPNSGNASALAQRPEVLARVTAIQAEQAEIAQRATQIAAERLSIDCEWVMSRLVENANRAMQAVAVENRDGPTGEYRHDGSVANRALELLGKEIGMFVDRSKVDLTAKMSVEEWLESLPSV